MKQLVLILAGAALVVPAAPQVVAAQAPQGDSVTSDAADCFVNDPECQRYTFLNLDARSGPKGENPVGTGDWGVFQPPASFTISGAVTCLAVSGNVATVGFTQAPGFDSTLVRVTDRGGPDSGQDLFEVVSQGSPSGSGQPPDCSSFPPTQGSDIVITRSGVNERGDIVVVDAPPPPTTYSQCRQAGWVKYGFASHAACIDYVHDLARRMCIWERVAGGITRFRAKYGLGPNDDHATRHCVRLYTGW
jgi:hypothetical protein